MITLAAADTIQGIAGTATAITYSIFGMELASGLETFKRLQQGQMAVSAGVLYTVPGSTQAFVKLIVLANTTGSAVTGVILYNGGTAATNQITGSLTIPANGIVTLSDQGLQITDASGNLLTTGTNSFDSTIVGVTTPLALSTSGTATLAAKRDHQHQSPGGIASMTAATSGINTTETILTSAVIPANLMQAGTTFRLMCSGVCTSTAANASNFRCRLGTAGNNTDVIPVVITPTAATSGTAIPFFVDLIVTIRTAGSGGTALGSGILLNNTSTGVSNANVAVAQTTATVAVNTTVSNTIQISYISAATTTTSTFHNAAIEIVKM